MVAYALVYVRVPRSKIIVEWYSSVWLVALVTFAFTWQAMYYSLTQSELTREPYIKEYFDIRTGLI